MCLLWMLGSLPKSGGWPKSVRATSSNWPKYCESGHVSVGMLGTILGQPKEPRMDFKKALTISRGYQFQVLEGLFLPGRRCEKLIGARRGDCRCADVALASHRPITSGLQSSSWWAAACSAAKLNLGIHLFRHRRRHVVSRILPSIGLQSAAQRTSTAIYTSRISACSMCHRCPREWAKPDTGSSRRARFDGVHCTQPVAKRVRRCHAGPPARCDVRSAGVHRQHRRLLRPSQ